MDDDDDDDDDGGDGDNDRVCRLSCPQLFVIHYVTLCDQI